MDPQGHAALVTGGGSGLGAASALELARAGAKVALLDINVDAAKKIAAEIGGIAVRCDVADADSAMAAVAAARDRNGPARILVNCAGIGPAKRIVGRDGPMPLPDFERVIAINLIGTFNMLRLAAADMTALPPLADDERGVIVSTASVAAFEGQIGQAGLAASVPFPKLLGRPEQFAELVLHCVRNTYLNGEVIRLDGALRMAPR